MLDNLYNKIQAIINRGQQANELVQNPAYQEAVLSVHQQYIDSLVTSKLNDTETRERCYMAIRALSDINMKLATFISDAKYEEIKQSQPRNGE